MKHYEFLGLAIAGAAIWWWLSNRSSVTVGTPSVAGDGIDTWSTPSAIDPQSQAMADTYGLYGF